jgi:hypothetical protein
LSRIAVACVQAVSGQWRNQPQPVEVDRRVYIAASARSASARNWLAVVSYAVVNATDTVAVIGVIGTAVVGIAGYVFNERRSRDDRATQRELAEGQRAHETQLRRSERAYEARRDTYVDLLRNCVVNLQHVQATEPLMTFKGDPGPPELPPEEEWRDLQARVSAFGSRDVAEAADAFYDARGQFYRAVGTFRIMRDRATGAEMEKATASMMTAREEVNAAFVQLKTLVRDDLANL